MSNGISHKIIRTIGVLVGLLFITVFVIMLKDQQISNVAWVAPFLGILFIVYGIGGYKALSKILPSYKKYTDHE
jgi:uncharacterized membrane protein